MDAAAINQYVNRNVNRGWMTFKQWEKVGYSNPSVSASFLALLQCAMARGRHDYEQEATGARWTTLNTATSSSGFLREPDQGARREPPGNPETCRWDTCTQLPLQSVSMRVRLATSARPWASAT
jgi:hypothetical protein